MAWPMRTEHVRSVRRDELDALDSRFIAATVEDADRMFTQFFGVEAMTGWWWRVSRRSDEDISREIWTLDPRGHAFTSALDPLLMSPTPGAGHRL